MAETLPGFRRSHAPPALELRVRWRTRFASPSPSAMAQRNGGGTATSCKHKGHARDRRSQRSTHGAWKPWPQGKRLKGSPSVKSLRQTAQQPCPSQLALQGSMRKLAMSSSLAPGGGGERGCSAATVAASSSRVGDPSTARQAIVVSTGFRAAATMHKATSCLKSELAGTHNHMAEPTMSQPVDTAATRKLHTHMGERFKPMAAWHGDSPSATRWSRRRSINQRGSS
mmetsp:Transcript_126420/g.363642  ORF Transcript_126420/g.363642 Transcript_126420/m.363642 type:complete len:227 (-) Transcript_126420:279-959(-)